MLTDPIWDKSETGPQKPVNVIEINQMIIFHPGNIIDRKAKLLRKNKNLGVNGLMEFLKYELEWRSAKQ